MFPGGLAIKDSAQPLLQLVFDPWPGNFFLSFLVFWLFLWAAPVAYGSSQARGRIGAVATGLHHSSLGSEQSLRPTQQLTATPDP